MFSKLFTIQVKRYFKIVSNQVVIIALLFSLVFVAKIGLEKMLKPQSNKVRVAFVMDPEMEQRPLFSSMLSSTSSLEGIVELHLESDVEATMKKLKNQDIDVLVDLPKDLVMDIRTGINTPVRVYYPANLGLQELLFKDLARGIASMLQSSQSAIYTLGRLSQDYGISDANAYLNEQFLKLALSRQSIFKTETLQTDTPNLQTHLKLVVYLNFMMILPIVFYQVINQKSTILARRLQQQGYSYSIQFLASFLAYVLVFMLMGLVLLIALNLFSFELWMSSCLVITGFSYAFFKWFDYNFSTLIYVLMVLTLSLLSGVLIFNSWLPSSIQRVNTWLMPRALYQLDWTILSLWFVVTGLLSYYKRSES